MIVEKGVEKDEKIIVHGINKVLHGSLADPITLADYNAELEAAEQAQLAEPVPEETPE